MLCHIWERVVIAILVTYLHEQPVAYTSQTMVKYQLPHGAIVLCHIKLKLILHGTIHSSSPVYPVQSTTAHAYRVTVSCERYFLQSSKNLLLPIGSL